MNMFIKVFWVISWMFCIGWGYYIVESIGWDVIMPMRLKLPLILSFFLPPFVWCFYSAHRARKEETFEDRFDINR